MIQPAVILAAVLASLIAAVSLAAPAKPEKPAPRRGQAEVSAKIKGPTKRPDRARVFR